MIKKITPEEADQIIIHCEPLGRFYTIVGKTYVGIDNSTGDAWTEDFRSLSSCKRWLNGKRAKSLYGDWVNG